MLFSKRRNWENRKTPQLSHRTRRGFNAKSHFRPRLEPLEDRTLMSAYLLKDINVNTDSSNPSNLFNMNGTLFFSATDNDNQIGLWKTDGTAAGTTLIREFAAPNYLQSFATVNGELFFEVSSFSPGHIGTDQVWKSDGTTAGTQLIQDFSGQAFFGAGIGIQNQYYYFTLVDPISNNAYLWVSDGTTTRQLDPGAFFNPFQFTPFNGELYFFASFGSTAKLWKTDGTDQGTQIADADVPDFSGSGLIAANGALYFLAASDATFQSVDFLKSDGTHTTILQTGLSPFSLQGEMAAASGKIFFPEATLAESYPPRLWVYDGTTTRELNPANVAPSGFFPENLHVINGQLIFNGSSIDHPGVDTGIWTSDGTDAGTVEITPSGLTSSFVPLFGAAQGNAFYFVDFPNQLWKTDGTAAGTSLVATINTPPELFSAPADLTFVGSTLFFTLNDGPHGQELWELTSAGAMLVKDINTDTLDSFPSQMVDANGKLFFTAFSGPLTFFDVPGPEVWTSDGTPAGTQLVGTPFPPLFPGDLKWPADLVNADGTVFFFGASGFNLQLWSVSAGAGLQLVKDFSNPNDFISAGYDMTAVGNKVFFTILDGNTGQWALWQSDGTSLGTTVVADNVYIVSGSEVAAGDKVFFVTSKPNSFAYQLWESDGTDSGTRVVDPNDSGTFIFDLTNVNGTLYYVKADSQLWKTDGTTATEVANLNPGPDFAAQLPPINVGGTLFIVVQDFNTGTSELWTSDGTAAGTVPVAPLPQADFLFGNNGEVMDAAALNGRLIFAAKDPVHGHQLWISDGTPQGTHPFTNLTPGHDGVGNSLFRLTTFADRVFFTATDRVHGQELWETDGTAGGTFMVQDINPGPASSMGGAFPQFVPSGGTLFFAADDGTHGTELWAYYPATHFQVTTTASIATPGSSFTVTVTALDHNNNVDTGYIGTAHFSSTDGSGILPADYKFTQSDHGVHSFSITLNTPGVQTVAVTDTDIGSLMGSVTLTVPRDVTNQTRAQSNGIHFDPHLNLFIDQLIIQNIGSTDIQGPVQIVLTGLTPGVGLVSAISKGVPLSIGFTASGDTIITLNVGLLRHGQALHISLGFSDPLALPIDFGVNVFTDSF